jgi:hypothetical protein
MPADLTRDGGSRPGLLPLATPAAAASGESSVPAV